MIAISPSGSRAISSKSFYRKRVRRTLFYPYHDIEHFIMRETSCMSLPQCEKNLIHVYLLLEDKALVNKSC